MSAAEGAARGLNATRRAELTRVLVKFRDENQSREDATSRFLAGMYADTLCVLSDAEARARVRDRAFTRMMRGAGYGDSPGIID